MAELFTFKKPATDSDDRAAALDIHTSCIVEAPAGSGKTGLLVQRFLKLLADDAVEAPEEVLAITFTRKATAEMHERVFEQLQDAHNAVPLKDDKPFTRDTRALALKALSRSHSLGWDILAQPQRLNIRSILSVCMELANARPLLAGNVGPQQPIEDPYSLYRQAARRTLLQLGGADRALHQALMTLLLHRDGSATQTEALIADMLHTREQWGELVPLDRPLDDDLLDNLIRPRLEQTLSSIVCSGLQRALDAMPAGVLEELTTFAANHAHLPGYNGKDSPIALCANKHEPPHTTAEHLDHWRLLIRLLLKPSDGDWRAGFARNHLGFEVPKTSAAHLKSLVQSIQTDALQAALCAVLDLPPATYPEEQWLVAKALFRVLRHALIELKLLFAERVESDFSEFALSARAALDSRDGATDLAIAAGGKLRHLLVDEMQDTSTSQYELIEALTQSWDGHSQTLFLVGDPKQSIYLFRQARVERFLRTMRERQIGDIDLTPLRLTANFRSQAALVEGFNDTFAGHIFPHPSNTQSNDVPFVPAIATRDQTQPLGIQWHTAILEDDAPDRAAQEAIEIRNIIQQRLATPLPADRDKPWRIAILARARGHLSAIIHELRAHDGKPEIPFRGVELDPLTDRPEVLDALALTRALLHPADRTAWLAVLHAPWCGLDRADLLALAGDDPEATIASLVLTRRDHLSPLGQQLLDRAWPILEASLETLGRTSLAIHVERTWRSLAGDAALTPEQQTNVLRFLSVLRELETTTNRIDLKDLTNRIDRLFAEPRAGDIQVDLMTIHKAKGLEWDLVLVPGLERRPRNSGGGLLNWLELDAHSPNDEASIILAPIWGKGEASDKLNDWIKDVRNRRDRAEEKRLFYVACTRAREELHLFAALARTTKGQLQQPISGTLLKAAWPAAEPHFNAQDLSSRPESAPTTLSSRPESASFADAVERPLYWTSLDEEQPLALAASATDHVHQDSSHTTDQVPQGFSLGSHSALEDQGALAPEGLRSQPQLLQRLPLAFNPSARFAHHEANRLAYPPASTIRQTPTFERPEGSFAVRAFGNVVHRYLQLLAARLTTQSLEALQAELPAWEPRLTASLRGEGLPPADAAREASRALLALTQSLTDPIGQWILSPHPLAASEQDLTTQTTSLRVDRTFLADDVIWIIDFKTTEQGSRSDAAFEASERSKYTAQLEAYANLRRTLPDGHLPIRLGLYYPLIPHLIQWHSTGTPTL